MRIIEMVGLKECSHGPLSHGDMRCSRSPVFSLFRQCWWWVVEHTHAQDEVVAAEQYHLMDADAPKN